MAKKRAVQTADEGQPVTQRRYRREKLAEMDKYRDKIDILIAVLRPDERYTVDQADGLIDRFMKGGAKA